MIKQLLKDFNNLDQWEQTSVIAYLAGYFGGADVPDEENAFLQKFKERIEKFEATK